MKDVGKTLADRSEKSNKLLFFVGTLTGGDTMRAIAFKGRVTYAFERGGTPICGPDAEKLLKDLSDEVVDGIIYEVSWENIPLWREMIERELSF